MKLKTWLDQERGRYAELAAHLNVSAGRMSQMASDGVPNKYMESVRDFTKGEVTLESMVRERADRSRRPLSELAAGADLPTPAAAANQVGEGAHV